MLDRVISFANGASSLVPHYGNKNAFWFTGLLLAETALRRIKDVNTTYVIGAKNLQVVSSFLGHPSFASMKVSLPTACVAGILPFIFENKISGKDKCDAADRPSFYMIIGSGLEILNIASKVVQSLAAGQVFQKMYNGQTEGKVRILASGVLLGLSLFNVRFRVTE